MNIGKDMPILARLIDLAQTMAIVIVISAIIGLILAFPVKWLWDLVFGKIYPITVWQAWGLNVLTGILFGKNTNGKK